MLFACIHVPDFPVEAVVRVERQYREHPVAVLAGKPPLVRVFAANQKAQELGIESGMTKLQAEAFPGAILRPRSPLEESTAHAALLHCARSFSPRVEDTASDTIILDISGLQRLFGVPQKIACDLARRASDLGLQANVAVASNPDAAMSAAHGFPGVTVIPAGQEAERLGNLPLDVLFCSQPSTSEKPARSAKKQNNQTSKEILETLESWGIRNFRTFAALPEIAVSERLGQRGVELQRLARGTTCRNLAEAEVPLDFEEVVELEHPASLLEPLLFVLNNMVEQLCLRLGARALAAHELQLRMELDVTPREEDEAPEIAVEPKLFERNLHLSVPLLNPAIFLKLLQLDLQSHSPGAPVAKIWLRAVAVPPRAAQGGLFLSLTPEPEKLELTLARISSIVGESRCGSPVLLDSYRSDNFRMERFSAMLARTRSWLNSPRPSLPLAAQRFFRPPLQVSVIVHAGTPVRLLSPLNPDLQGEIVWAAGPWGKSGEWWSQKSWQREEWDIAVRNKTIALYRVFQAMNEGKWFVESSYD